MGKRKSKTSKQKQAKAAAKSLKARVVKDHRIQVNQTSAATDSPAVGKKNKKGRSPKNGEDAEFQRQQASMQERHMAEVQQKQRMMTKNNHKRGKKDNTGKKKISSLDFHAPTLIVDDAQKSTNQLVGEMAQKVHGWDGISSDQNHQLQQQNDNPFASKPQQPISLKQVYQNSTLQQQQQMEQERQTQQQKSNRFSLLQNDDDDSDNEETSQQQQQQQPPSNPLFQFAPPSFAVPSSGSGATTNDNVDPDL